MDVELLSASTSPCMGARDGSRRSTLSVLVAGLSLVSCEADVALARGQALVVVDTDMPIVGQLLEHPELSADAALDTVRIDVFRDDGSRDDFLDVVVPEVANWPLSFGIASEGKRAVRIQIRAFKASYAVRGELNGRDTLEPRPELTIDRVADIPLPSEGVQRVVVRLSGDCLGIRPSFDGTTGVVTTCVDGAHPSAAPSEGVVSTDDVVTTSAIGTWAPAVETPCAAADDDARVCIEGGFMLLGDDAFDGYPDGITYLVESSPVRPVAMSPFYMDRTEVTVGHLESLLARGVTIQPMPRAFDAASADDRFCTWQAGDPTLPLNCVDSEAATQICAATGGVLPTEAQWEYAARGRGLGRIYPWGDEAPKCCSAAAHLLGTGTCGPIGPRPVGGFTGADGCVPFDVSRDGVVDLAGGLLEMTRDATLSYDDPCWAKPGLLHDPYCSSSEVLTRVSRGSGWQNRVDEEVAALRRTALDASSGTGFRCVVPESP